MKTGSLVITGLFCIAFATGCSNVEAPRNEEKSRAADQEHRPDPSSTRAGRAQGEVEPGSHEDWCAEHQVPESLCTRCNPSLIAAFKATGDWCEEHGLPESQCRVCNPDLKIERPPKEGGE